MLTVKALWKIVAGEYLVIIIIIILLLRENKDYKCLLPDNCHTYHADCHLKRTVQREKGNPSGFCQTTFTPTMLTVTNSEL